MIVYSSGEDALLGRMNESPVLKQQKRGGEVVGAAPNSAHKLALCTKIQSNLAHHYGG